jgi:small subunit ribosomal protein S4
MKIGPKFKIARRLGAPIFEKTQTAKYAQSLARKERSGKGSSRPKSEFGQALIEKQKARLTYGLSERQFRGYVDKAIASANPTQKLFSQLETRLDNVLFRSGLAKTRSQARQAATHGHATVSGRRVDVPSVHLKTGDVVSLREASAQSPLFAEVTERMKTLAVPAWLEVNPEAKTAKVVGEPVLEAVQNVFDLRVVLEYYNK